MEIKDSVIVITGGAKGIGYAMAEVLANEGANIALIDSNQQVLEKAAADLALINDKCQGYCVDITDEELISDTFNYILEDFGKVNVVINNAGILRDGMLVKVKDGQFIDQMSLEQFQSVINVNLTGTFLCGREGAKAMIASGQQGLIINISSIARGGNIGQTNYSAAKAGVSALAVTWSKELARFNIRSAAIAPGVVASDMTASMKPEALARLEKAAPVARLGDPQEIAQAAKFIIENDFYNGRTLELDGGLTL
ncbi:SDR family oxidoreductase [Paraferrimonas sp. SM1919]|uniref:SDR family oxidoreductase n=1 Tax=Paraferrimonas sp. SM1919 TaxID=2662263 RepID=UPI0013D01213|nr:SDR family oxidoreductase [Paraferrimonas sp. SM1919]